MFRFSAIGLNNRSWLPFTNSRLLQCFNIKSSIFNITALTPINWKEILENVRETKKIIIIDDSKSQNLACENLINFLHDNCDIQKKIILKRKIENNWLYPISDEMVIDYQKIKDSLHIV